MHKQQNNEDGVDRSFHFDGLSFGSGKLEKYSQSVQRTEERLDKDDSLKTNYFSFYTSMIINMTPLENILARLKKIIELFYSKGNVYIPRASHTVVSRETPRASV